MGTIKTSLQDVLFTKAQRRILAILYGRPDHYFYTNEIIRLSDSGTGAVQRELAKLTEAGLITFQIVGNQKQYQANRHNPLFSELRSIVLKTFGLADILKEALQPVVSDIFVAFVYGSVAKQEDTANSDIDLLILSDTLTYADLFSLLTKAEEKLSRKINPTCYSNSEWMRKIKQKNNFVMQVKNQPKIYIVGGESEFEIVGKFGQNRSS